MKLVKGARLPSDEIRVRMGYDGTECEEVALRGKTMTPGQCRMAIVVNTFYPEFQGRTYLNRRLIGMMQDVPVLVHVFPRSPWG